MGLLTLNKFKDARERHYHRWGFQHYEIKYRKKKGSIIRDPFGENLEDLMEDLDLLDPMPKNWKYTWNNKRTGPCHIAARLDRFLVSTFLIQKDLLPSSYIIYSATYDHKPISLSLAPLTNISPIPFRLNPIWIHNAKTLDIIHSVWNSNFSSSPNFIWETKLRVVHYALGYILLH